MKKLIFLLLISCELFGQQEFFHAQNKGLLLDEYPNAAAAYSLRRVNSRYTGALIRVRRDSTGQAEQDIGSIGEALDTVALKAFVRNNSGFVTTWYDQSGNARNATQTTAANQPRIVNAGVVDKTNGKPSMFFDGSNDWLSYNSYIFLGSQERTLYTVYNPNNATGSFVYSIFGQSFGTSNGFWSFIQSRTTSVTGDPYFAGFSADLGNGLSTPNVLQKLAQFYYNGTTGSLYKNNVLLASSNITLNAQTTGRISIGCTFIPQAIEFANANIQECIAYPFTQINNRSQIQQNINSYYAIY